MNRQEIIEVYNQGPDAVVQLVEGLIEKFTNHITEQDKKIEILTARVSYLENQLSKNSRNSSKPPSSDSFKKPVRTKSLRKKSGKHVGGQKGHTGYQLEQVSNPHHTEVHGVNCCGICGKDLSHHPATAHEKRQVFDLPPLHMEVTEHQAEIKECFCCGEVNRGVFPVDVECSTQYGPRIKALSVYMMNGQFTPYDRQSEFIAEVFHHRLSTGSLYNFNRSCYNLLGSAEQRIKADILNSPVVHFDETGSRLSGKNHWLHSASTSHSTFYGYHEKRGREAFDALEILGKFTGIAVHDHWKSYFNYDCLHSLCNAHHLRELTFLEEEHQESWAGKMKKLLKAIKSTVDYHGKRGKVPLPDTIRYFGEKYSRIVREGLQYHKEKMPLPEQPVKRGRKKQASGKNMLDRLRDHKKEVLAFLHNREVPFDNNQAERDIRMTKLKDKISGCYRSIEGARFFCRIRGFVSTVRKREMQVLASIEAVLMNQAPI